MLPLRLIRFLSHCLLIFAILSAHAYGSTVDDTALFFPHSSSFPSSLMTGDDQQQKVIQTNSFSIKAEGPDGFDFVKILRFSNEHYLATYFQNHQPVYRALYQPADQKVFAADPQILPADAYQLPTEIADKHIVEVDLTDAQYEPLNVPLNVAKMVSKGFVGHLRQAHHCSGQPDCDCATGYLTQTDNHFHYQPYPQDNLYQSPIVEEFGRSTRITMTEEKVTIDRNGQGFYRFNDEAGRQQGDTPDTRPKNSPKKESQRQQNRSTADAQGSGSSKTSGESSRLLSADDGDEDDDEDPEKRNRNTRKEPDDYQEPPEPRTPKPLNQTQIMQYVRLITEALQYQINQVVTIDRGISELLRVSGNSPETLARVLINDLRERFGITEEELTSLRQNMISAIQTGFSTGAWNHRDAQDRYYFTALLNAYLVELNWYHPRLPESQQRIVADLLTLSFYQVITFRDLEQLRPYISDNGFTLPRQLQEAESHEDGCPAHCSSLPGCLPWEPLSRAVGTTFSAHSAFVSFVFLLLSYTYYNADDLFGPDVETDRLQACLVSTFSTGACLIASVLNTAALRGVLAMSPGVSTGETLLLGGLNSLKDLFSVLGLFFGIVLPDRPEGLRFCQTANGIFGAAFALYLIHITEQILNTRDNRTQISATPGERRRPLLQGEHIMMLFAATSFFYGGSWALDQLVHFQHNHSNLPVTTFSSLFQNIVFPSDTPFEEAVRFGCFVATAFTLVSLYRQHSAVGRITAADDNETRELRQNVSSMRAPFNVRSYMGLVTLYISFSDLYGNNPLPYWLIPILDTIKSIYFERSVRQLREGTIATHIYNQRTRALEQNFNEAIRSTQIEPDMRLDAYIEDLFNHLQQANINTERTSNVWLRQFITHGRLQALLEQANCRDDPEQETHVIRRYTQSLHPRITSQAFTDEVFGQREEIPLQDQNLLSTSSAPQPGTRFTVSTVEPAPQEEDPQATDSSNANREHPAEKTTQ